MSALNQMPLASLLNPNPILKLIQSMLIAPKKSKNRKQNSRIIDKG